jgi:hypothetical protein
MAEMIEGGTDDRAAMIAEMRGLTDAPSETPAPAPAAKETDVAEDSGEADGDDSGVDEAAASASEGDGDDELDAEPETPVEEDEPEVDPETAKRFQQVQRQEKRAREALAAERREFEAERERWRDENKEKLSRVERFEKLQERARYDLAAVAKELGITEEEFEYHAERLYRLSPKGQKDPRNKQMTEQALREREAADRIARLEKQLEERSKKEEEERTAAEQKRAAEAYLDQTQKTVSAEKHPLVAKMLKADPDWGRDKLRRTAARMIQETGEVPKHAAVVAELEKRERVRLQRLGVDIPQVGGTKDPSGAKAPTKVKHPGAGETTRPQPKSGGSERPAPKTQEDERREIVQAMKAGILE